MSDVRIPDGLPVLPADRLIPTPWNPNAMGERHFQRLVQSIQEDGFVEPILVVKMTEELRRKYVEADKDDGGDWWLIVGGHHRWQAARVLDMPNVPAVVAADDWDEDKVKLTNAKMNMLRGKMDPVKFVALYEEMAAKHGEELVKQGMALLDEKELKNLIRAVRGNLPAQMQDKLDARADDVETPDDLARILNELFTKYGDTLKHGYMVFTYGGKTHCWVEMSPRVKTVMAKLQELSGEHELSLAALLESVLTNAEKTVEKALPKLIEKRKSDAPTYE